MLRKHSCWPAMKEQPTTASYLLAALLVWSSTSISLVYGIPKPSVLFVFGDSYSDTGNHNKSEPSWQRPYGITWPGAPDGRFSDGRILTDFMASFLKVPLPVPFRELREGKINLSSSSSMGVNFALGGSGVFDTFGLEYLNVSAQVTQFQGLMHDAGLNQDLIGSSLVLLSYAGNDYIKYVTDHRASSLGVFSFIPLVTSEIASNLRSLYQLGFRTFVVTNIEPAGCLPAFTRANNFTSCNDTGNLLSTTHNQDLAQNLDSIRKLPGSQVVVLDQFSSFTTVLSNPARYGISQAFEPCCLGSGNHTCGNVDAKGQRLFKVCENPEAAFFWDNSHPTQTGWKVLTEHYQAQLTVDATKTTAKIAEAAATKFSRGEFIRFVTVLASILWLVSL